MIRFSIAAALLAALVLSEAGAVTLEEQKAKDSNNKVYRDGSKAIRAGRYEDAIKTFNQILNLDSRAINETSGFEQSGILGGDFLMNFRVTIDFNRALVAFHPPAESVTRRDYQ
jgi:hypothetical protein